MWCLTLTPNTSLFPHEEYGREQLTLLRAFSLLMCLGEGQLCSGRPTCRALPTCCWSLRWLLKQPRPLRLLRPPPHAELATSPTGSHEPHREPRSAQPSHGKVFSITSY